MVKLVEKDSRPSFMVRHQCERSSSERSATSAWNYNGNNGNCNNNNKNNTLAGVAVADFQQNEVIDLYLLLFSAYLECRKNKRRTHNQVAFEVNYPERIYGLATSLYNRCYIPKRSISFIVTKPKIREIMAASFSDRVVQTYFVMRLKPLVEKVLNNNSFSCRLGKGSLAAIANVYNDIFEASNGYTEDCYIAKMDLSNFFMSIDKNLLVDRLTRFIQERYEGRDKDLLIYLARIIYYNVPAEHAIRKSPTYEWENVPAKRSLYHAEWSVGLAIGNVTAQFAANFLTTSYLDLLQSFGIKVTHYTDDTVLIAKSKDRILEIMPTLRKHIHEELHLRIHPKKFYIQHYSKSLPFLAYKIRKDRILPSNRIVHNLKEKVRLFGVWASEDSKFIYRNAEKICSALNSYFGILVHANTYRLRRDVTESVLLHCGNALFANDAKTKFTVKDKYKKINQRIYVNKLYKKNIWNRQLTA